MGLNNLFGNKERKEEQRMEKAEAKQKDFIKDREMFAAGMDDDETYLAMKEARSDLTRWQQDLDDSIEQLQYDLMNYVKTDKGWVQDQVLIGYQQDGKGNLVKGDDGKPVEVWEPMRPMVNKFGVYRIISLVRRYLNRNVMMSNLNDDIILRMLRRLKVDLVLNLGANVKDYEMNQKDLSIIVKMIMDPVEATLYRAYNNGERVHLNTINKRVEAFSEASGMPQQKRKGLLGGMM
jgi:hypothetical protein